ncbi:MAG: GAF domain-containing protein [Chitinophagaceae bacterium]|nr:MAG: GAF domain-containing protein [Chitinophagaceae bacterium]
MSEDLDIVSGTKQEKYEHLYPQLSALLEGESDMVANMGNISAALKEQFNWLWVGFYMVRGEELVLGPFQGPVACTRIRKGMGVCGKCWEDGASVVVGDVLEFKGHISCSSLSRAEIVVPVLKDGNVIAVLDADSEFVDHFDDTDREWLEKITLLLS